MSDVDISICVATYRRRYGLARLLDSLARMKLPEGVRAEVIVVDNDPASDPREAVEQALEAVPPAIGGHADRDVDVGH